VRSSIDGAADEEEVVVEEIRASRVDSPASALRSPSWPPEGQERAFDVMRGYFDRSPSSRRGKRKAFEPENAWIGKWELLSLYWLSLSAVMKLPFWVFASLELVLERRLVSYAS